MSERDVEDIVQEAFCAYYSHRYTLTEAGMWAVLTKILHNLSMDYLRKQKMHPIITGEEVLPEEKRVIAGRRIGRDCLLILLERQEYEEIAKALNELSEDGREILRLCAIEGRSVREASRLLGISEGACRVCLYRARKRMRELLREYDEDR